MWGRISIFLGAALLASLVAGVWFGQVLSRNAPVNVGAQLEDERAMRQAIGGDAALRVPEPPQPRVDGTIGVPQRAQMAEAVQLVSVAETQDGAIAITTEQNSQSGSDPLAALIESRILAESPDTATPPREPIYRIGVADSTPSSHTAAPYGSTPPTTSNPAPSGFQAPEAAPSAPRAAAPNNGTGARAPGGAPSGQPASSPRRISRDQLPPDLAFAVAQPAEAPPDLPPLATTPAQPAGQSPSTAPGTTRAQSTAGWQSSLRSDLSRCDSLREPGRSECIYRTRVQYCNGNNGWGQVPECPAVARPR